MGLLVWGYAAFYLLSRPDADNPPNLDESPGLIFDGPSKCHNARNRVLFGRWITDEWTPYIHSPVHTLLTAVTFRCCGVNLATMRLPGVVATLGTLALLFFLLADCDKRVAALALIFAATGHVFLMYGRSGLIEPLASFFLMLSLWALNKGYRAAHEYPSQHRGIAWFVGAGLAAGVTYLTKPTTWYFSLVALIATMVRRPARRRYTTAFVAALAVVVLCYFAVFLPLNRPWVARESSFWFSRATLFNPLKNWMRQPLFLELRHIPLLVALAFLTLPMLISRKSEDSSGWTKLPLLVLGGSLVVGTQFLALVTYRPTRYYVPLLPAIFALSAFAFVRAWDWIQNPKPTSTSRGLRDALFVLTLAYVLLFGLLPRIRVWISPNVPWPFTTRILMSMASATLLYLFWRQLRPRIVRTLSAVTPPFRRGIALVMSMLLIAPILSANMRANERWRRHAETSMRDFSRMLGRDYRDSVFAGTSPLFAVMENQHRALKVTPYGINARSLSRGDITHFLLSSDGADLRTLRRALPHFQLEQNPLERISISGYLFDLYPVTLRPLTAQLQKRDGRWVLGLTNTDPHSPQSATWLVLQERAGSIEVRGSGATRVLPNERKLIFMPSDFEQNCDVYCLPRHCWLSDALEITGKHIRWRHDPLAWNLRAWRLRPPSRAPEDEECFLEIAISNRSPCLVGVRLRGSPHASREVRLEEWRGGQLAAEHRLPVSELRADGYRTYVAWAATDVDRLRVVYRGRPPLFVNGFLAISRADLESFRVESADAPGRA